MGLRSQNSLQSKYDQTSNISKSVFISNFPNDCTSKDLWKACNDYGTVVDVFIPNKRSKTGKRFAFVRFIKVTNLIRLVENLNTIWLGRLHLSANFARFDRPIAPLAQKAKQVIFHNEGFHNTRIVYLGGLWVLVELNSSKSKLKFMKHVGVASWFSHLCNAQSDFVAKERIAWVDIEGVPLNAWSRLTFQKIVSKWGEMVDLAHHTRDSLEGIGLRILIFGDNGEDQGCEQPHGESKSSPDPFNIYDILDKRSKVVRPSISDSSIPYPSGVARCSGCFAEVENTDNGSSDSIVKGFKPKEGHGEDHWISRRTSRFPMNCLSLNAQGLGSKAKKDWIKELIFYAPQSGSSKRILWNYLDSLITNWNGERAAYFNSFISNVGLLDIQLEGYSFTWAHPSATKMSKLDRFLMTNGFLSAFPHISALCLDRHLSDHRPILLKEIISDYGPTPFRFYHSWLELPGFDDMISKDARKQQVGQSIDLKAKLCDIDKELDQGGVSDDILLSRMEIMKQLHDIQSSKHRDLIQKAKIRWAIEGDENSKYFHAIINKKRINLSVKGIMVDGDWIVDPSLVKQEFRCHFAERFLDPGPCRVKWFFEHGNFATGCNSSFVALIPKVLDPKVVSDYRPISLIGSLYKVITKILASRLSMVISDLISDVQSAFLPNRQILDGPFIINEILARCKAKKQQAMIFKVDFAKAYDSIRWDFLDDVLASFGFGSKWRSWIRGSLSSGRASILVNGSPTTEFQFFRGLKQGDPLAPFLFLLIMEAFHLSFNRATDAGIFKGLKIDSSLSLSHLFFADDAVFVGEWSQAKLIRDYCIFLDVFLYYLACQLTSLRAIFLVSVFLKIVLSRQPSLLVARQ
ncbi:RNA-directed DNA polymerase, eukaryota [Tanacetum coccineum]